MRLFLSSFLPSLAGAALLAIVSITWARTDDLQEATKLYKQGNKAEAQTRLSAYLSGNPKDARARFLMGVIYTEQKRDTEALKIFTDLTEDHPELPEPYNNLAVLHAAQGDYDKARKALETAIRTHPSYAIAHENLGDIYATLARQAYDKALQFDNNNNAARSKLALIKELVPKSSTTIAQLKPEAETPAPTAPPPAKETIKPEPSKQEKVEHLAPSDASADILKSVQDWAHAWAGNDADRYLSFYAADFRTPNGEPRTQWEASRRARLAKPKKIAVTVSGAKVSVQDPTHAKVAFRQHYQSDSLKTSGSKTLDMIKRADRWLIQREVIDR